MHIIIITAGPIEWGSSRMRGFWVADELRRRGHQVQVVPFQDREKINYESDVVIWQKTADIELIATTGGLHFWDVCDPAWWWQPDECADIPELVDGVVASSKALADDYNRWHPPLTPTAVPIPDCLDFTRFLTRRVHEEVEPVRLIWYGIAANRIALWAAKAPLERLAANGYRFELTIMDDRPDVRFGFSDAFPIYHTLWSLERELEIITSHDIALLPPYPGPWGRVKSNNKLLTAVACGLPVATDNYEVLEMLIVDQVARRDWATDSLRAIRKTNDIAVAASLWERLIGARA